MESEDGVMVVFTFANAGHVHREVCEAIWNDLQTFSTSALSDVDEQYSN
jgi:hypothetical protein